MGKCDVCLENISKYKCPRCMVATCSLSCVKQHKLNTKCSGIRDKAEFVDMKEFDDRRLLNDYRFLEEASRKVDSTTRDDLKRRRNIPNFLKELRRNAKNRKIDLRIMPYPMEKRKNNFTTFHIKSQTMLWQIKWVFPKSDTTYIGKRISENSILKDLIKSYIDPTDGDAVCRQKLKEYTQRGTDRCRLFIKVEGRPANSIRYYELDQDRSLLENLAGKTIVEYPIIYVEFGDCSEYVLLESSTGIQSNKDTRLEVPERSDKLNQSTHSENSQAENHSLRKTDIDTTATHAFVT